MKFGSKTNAAGTWKLLTFASNHQN